MIDLDAAQTRNLTAVLPAIVDRAVRSRVAFCGWTESRWRNLANDGRNLSHSPGVTPEIAAILRRSLDLPHDGVGSNGRSTGVMQQTSTEVRGSWGDMAGTMTPSVAAARFMDRIEVTDNPVFRGLLATPTGPRWVNVTLSSPIAADVLRVQQPLANEAESDNYGPAQVAVAVELAAHFAPPAPQPAVWYLDRLLGRQ